MLRLLCTTAPFALLSLAPVQAQEFYLGLGVGAGSISPSGFDDYNELSVIGGVQYPVSGNFFLGGEVEAGTASGSADIDGVSRLRVLAGIKTQDVSFFVAAGAVRMRGPFADLSGESSGTSFGIGIEVPVQDRFKLRVEAIRDSYDTGGTIGKVTLPDWKVDTLRVGAFFRF
ncbi:MAG: outer membrane beta-barrel protein [Paracoccaceae bacterium]|nr:MAG: outer membrane beta-barrel protein [Paracoccaceae bacterium]